MANNTVCDRDRFIAALELARCVGSHGTKDAQYVGMYSRQGTLCVCASSGNGHLDRVDVEVDIPGKFSELDATVHTKKFLRIIKALPPGDFSIRQRGKILEINAGKMSVEIKGLPEPGWSPWVPEPMRAKKFPSARLCGALKRVRHAMCSDESIYNLHRIAIDGESIVTTDGHRLAVAPLDLPLDKQVCIGGDGVHAILAAPWDGDAHIAIRDKHIYVWSDDVRMRILDRLVTYVAWRQVIPASVSTCVHVHRGSMMEVLRQMLASVSLPSVPVTMEISELAMRLWSKDREGVGVTAVLSISGGPTAPMTMGLNAHYLLDALESIGEHEHVTLGISGNLDPVVVSAAPGNSKDFNIVMPLRI